MEQLFAKLCEYLKMDTEISFEEFSEYYQQVIKELNANFSNMNRDERLKARYICSIVQANAESRAKRSKQHAKPYKKMAAKCAFWADAINYHLLKDGMSQAEIDEKTQQINDSI